MCWQLARVRGLVPDPETGKLSYDLAPDTAKGINARFQKMQPKRDEYAGRGHGVTCGPVRMSPATIEAKRINGCARTFAPADAPATIVVPTKITKRMRRTK
jgi:hypothetical protein